MPRESTAAKAAIIGRAGADQLFIVHLADKQRIEANTIDRVGCVGELPGTKRKRERGGGGGRGGGWYANHVIATSRNRGV